MQTDRQTDRQAERHLNERNNLTSLSTTSTYTHGKLKNIFILKKTAWLKRRSKYELPVVLISLDFLRGLLRKTGRRRQLKHPSVERSATKRLDSNRTKNF